MSDPVIATIVVGGLGLIVLALWLLARRTRRRGVGAVMGPFEEIWHPLAHQSRVEIRQQVERRTPSPSPGDPPTTDVPPPTRD